MGVGDGGLLTFISGFSHNQRCQSQIYDVVLGEQDGFRSLGTQGRRQTLYRLSCTSWVGGWWVSKTHAYLFQLDFCLCFTGFAQQTSTERCIQNSRVGTVGDSGGVLFEAIGRSWDSSVVSHSAGPMAGKGKKKGLTRERLSLRCEIHCELNGTCWKAALSTFGDPFSPSALVISLKINVGRVRLAPTTL
jgi:hypothetical protein